ncbi:MAG: transposase [Candidatus Binatia bacterium]|jgi:putative transposase
MPCLNLSLARVLIHLVFSTKNRDPLIPAALHGELHAYIGTVLHHLDCLSLRVGGTDDHVHILYALARTRALATVTEKVKTASSKWMKRHGVTALAWQTGYGAFSVSEVDARSACRYIEHQATHHARCSYQEEFRGFLRRSHVDCDERYVWE